MVYESDFYTSRRPYSRPTVTSYTVTRREVDWSKHPTVARPSQVSLPYLVFARRPQRDTGAGVGDSGVCGVPRMPAALRGSAPRTHSRVLFEDPVASHRPSYRYAY